MKSMAKIVSSISYDFDDLHIITDRVGIVSSRNDVKFNNNRIVVAPMSAIQNSEFNKECIRNGLSLPVHRFCTPQEQQVLMTEAVETIELNKSASKLWLSVGLKDWKERFDLTKKLLERVPFQIMLDVAYCHTEACIEEILKIKKYTSLQVSSGNVHTGKAFYDMQKICNEIRCGIGAGEACLTTPNTGIGRGQLSVVLDCAQSKVLGGESLMSDGGIRKPGDVAKAFGAGATSVMIGGMFKEAIESQAFQSGVFYGGASSYAKSIVGNENRYIEGRALEVTKVKASSVKQIADSISDGVKSAVSYCGYDDIVEFIGNAVFEVKA